MSLALILDIPDDPRQIFRSKTDDSVSGLPIERLEAQLLVGFVRGIPFQLPDPFADCQRWRNADSEMDVGFNAADCVTVDAGSIDATSTKIMVNDGFHLRRQERRTSLRVPSNMQIDLSVEVSSHVQSPGV